MALDSIGPPLREMRFERRPSTVLTMVKAFFPSPGFPAGAGAPHIAASWRGHRIDPAHLRSFLGLTGLGLTRGLPVLYPHVLGFPLQMSVLTHPAFPVPIWKVLQVRNHLFQHRRIPPDAVVDIETRTTDTRFLDRGVEIDLRTVLVCDGVVSWESVNTFYSRGGSNAAQTDVPIERAPDRPQEVYEQWHMPSGTGWRFAGLTGDYNGIHWWGAYARRLGFRRALHHPQLVLGQCLARLPALTAGPALRLDAWLKGPVYYDSDVRLSVANDLGETRFALGLEGDERAAVIGRLRAGRASELRTAPFPAA
jgi:hypothetical protein